MKLFDPRPAFLILAFSSTFLLGAQTLAAVACDPRNIIQEYVAAKKLPPLPPAAPGARPQNAAEAALVREVKEEAAASSRDLDARFPVRAAPSSAISQYKMEAVLNEAEEYVKFGRLRDPNMLARGPENQNTLETARDALNILKRRNENVAYKLKSLAKQNPEIEPLIAKPIRDLEIDRRNIEKIILATNAGKKGVSAADQLANIRMLSTDSLVRYSSGSLGELQVAARLPKGVRKDLTVAQIILAETGKDFEAEVKRANSYRELTDKLDKAVPASHMAVAEKLRMLNNKEIDIQYSETTPAGTRDVWSEVKATGHVVTPNDLFRIKTGQTVSGQVTNANLLDQLNRMKAARDLAVQVLGKDIQLELIFTGGITPEAKTLINEVFPGVFRYR